MFLNTSILTRIMKKAYKKGIKIGKKDGNIYLAGDYWEMECKEEFLPNKIKGLIIELSGKLPEDGELMTSTKDGNQMEMDIKGQIDTEGFYEEIEETSFLLFSRQGTVQRIYQDTKNNRLYLINNVFAEMIDDAAVMSGKGETGVYDPKYHTYRGILWQNNVGKFKVRFRGDEHHERQMEELSMIDLTEDMD